MSQKARTDEIDELVSSVRNFVSHKDTPQLKPRDQLVLTPELRVAEYEEITIEVAPVNETEPLLADNVLQLDTAKSDAARAGLEATIAELEAAVTAQSEDWEPDEGESFDEPEAWAASAFDAPFEVNHQDDAAEEAAETDVWADVSFDTPFEVMLSPDADLASEVEADPDSVPNTKSELDAELAHYAAPFDVDEMENSIAERVTSSLDDDDMRALVVATLQDELSGELGERITRNVRKLVRREINRVLASRELGQS